MPKQINLRLLTQLDPTAQQTIRQIRNEPNVRRWMYTDHEITPTEHQQWLDRLQHDAHQLVFAIINDQQPPLGVVSLNQLDKYHRKSDWAYYLTESVRGGLGAAIEYALVEFAFETLDLEKLNCEVIDGNETVLRMHAKFLFEPEGFRKSNIIKNGNRVGVHLLGLQKTVWQSGRDQVTQKYRRILNKYSINFQWP